MESTLLEKDKWRHHRMRLDPQAIINSRLGVGLALGLGRNIPPGAGYRLAEFVADTIADRADWKMVQAVRANQWVVSGGKLSPERLNHAVQATLRNTGHSIYDLYHYIHDVEALHGLIEFDPTSLRFIERSQREEDGLVLVGVHLCGFDLALQAASLHGLKAMAITLPDLNGGYQWQFEMRKRVGLEIEVASVATLHQAIHRLQEGGTVLTGLDRPFPGLKHQPRFFGRPASIPIHHVRLALKAKVPVVVGSCVLQPDGTYKFLISEDIHMETHPDKEVELLTNAETVLQAAEEIIFQAPHQWAMFYPVWPEVLEQIP
jgi:lauroyl/myristoyl acyltransferase